MRWVFLWILAGCEPVDDAADEAAVTLAGVRQVVPSDGLPGSVAPMPANNNLDVTVFQGRVFLAFRTAPTHFASTEVRIEVVSSDDERTWRHEGSFAVGADLREPQLVVFGDTLRLYATELGTSSLDFEPRGVRTAVYLGAMDWTELEPVYTPGFLAWRIKPLFDGEQHLAVFGYQGGENVYDVDGEPITIELLGTDDGTTWTPWSGDDPAVLVGGGSESDGVVLDDGRLVTVVRNEAGDETGFGSKVCVAPAGSPMDWDCATDPRKFDSPLMFRAAGRVWLVARRNVTDDGAYDLGRDDLSLQEQFLAYSSAYWQAPKRCAVWTVDPDARSVTWVADLPSKGDTCFPDYIERNGTIVVYNYSSPPDGPELSWIQGQVGPTGIWRQELTLR